MYANPTIYNLTLTTAGTEYSQVLSPGMHYFEVSSRNMNDMKLSFVSGQSGTNYITIPAGSVRYFRGRFFTVPSGLTIYLQSPSNSVVAEILVWS